MNNISSIIFDCDGTLVETEYENTVAFIEILSQYGVKHMSIELFMKEFKGLTLLNMQEKIFNDFNITLPDNWIPHFREFRNQHFLKTGIKSVEGIPELLSVLQNKKIDFCVASQGRLQQTDFSLQLTNLTSFFPEKKRFSSEQVPNPKPAPDLFLHALNSCNFNIKNTIVIEDSLVGVQAGISAGISTVGFTQDPFEKETFLQLGATQVISSISEVHTLL